MSAHIWHDCKIHGHIPQASGSCLACDGGLGGCVVCGQWEGDIEDQDVCPGQKATHLVLGLPTDPEDRWLFAEPRSPEKMAEYRAEMIAEHGGPEGFKFTCDDCCLAPRCTLTWDSYNTNGDCLYGK